LAKWHCEWKCKTNIKQVKSVFGTSLAAEKTEVAHKEPQRPSPRLRRRIDQSVQRRSLQAAASAEEATSLLQQPMERGGDQILAGRADLEDEASEEAVLLQHLFGPDSLIRSEGATVAQDEL